MTYIVENENVFLTNEGTQEECSTYGFCGCDDDCACDEDVKCVVEW